MNWDWIRSNIPTIVDATIDHLILTLIAVVMGHQHIGDSFHANLCHVVKHVATTKIHQDRFTPGTKNIDVAGIAKKAKLINDTCKHDSSKY